MSFFVFMRLFNFFQEQDVEPNALFLFESCLKTLDLKSPKEFEKIESSADNSLDLIVNKLGTISDFEEFVYEWATKKDLEVTEKRGTIVYEAEIELTNLDKFAIQSMKSKGHITDQIIDCYAHFLNKKEFAAAKKDGRRMKRFCFTVWPAVFFSYFLIFSFSFYDLCLFIIFIFCFCSVMLIVKSNLAKNLMIMSIESSRNGGI